VKQVHAVFLRFHLLMIFDIIAIFILIIFSFQRHYSIISIQHYYFISQRYCIVAAPFLFSFYAATPRRFHFAMPLIFALILLIALFIIVSFSFDFLSLFRFSFHFAITFIIFIAISFADFFRHYFRHYIDIIAYFAIGRIISMRHAITIADTCH
jgi:hypothetical protein